MGAVLGIRKEDGWYIFWKEGGCMIYVECLLILLQLVSSIYTTK